MVKNSYRWWRYWFFGWGGNFSKDISQKDYFEHTINTIQYLAENPSKPCRMFTVDRVLEKRQ